MKPKQKSFTTSEKVKIMTIVNGFRRCGIIPEPARYISSSHDNSAASDTTDANEDQLASVMELFHDDSEFYSNFDGFQAETVKHNLVTVYYIVKTYTIVLTTRNENHEL